VISVETPKPLAKALEPTGGMLPPMAPAPSPQSQSVISQGQPGPMDRPNLIILIGLCVSFLIATLIFFIPPSMEKLSGDISDLYIDAGGVFFFILCLYLLTIKGTPEFKLLSVFLFLFISFFVAADIISSYYRFFLNGNPDLGPADVLWDIGYFPLIFITYYTVWKNHEHLKLRTFLVTLIVWVVVFVGVIMPAIIISYIDTSNMLQTLVLSLSPPLDMILILGFVLVLFVYQEGDVLRYWLFLTFGFVAMALGDISYLLLPDTQDYYLNSLPTFFYTLCYPLMSLGVFFMIVSPQKFQSFEPAGRSIISQVFVAHKKGTLLAHVMTKVAKRVVDTDIMVGMLTAIQDFVKESFEGEKHKTLDELKYGDMRLVFRRGPDFMLVAVISGQMTHTVQQALDNTVSMVQQQYGNIISNWDGTTKDVEGVKGIVSKLLSIE
jgi:hypothetical protein